MCLKFTNDRTAETVTVPHDTRHDLAAEFATLPANDWIWFWMARAVAASRTGASKTEIIGLMFMIAIGHGIKRPRITVRYNGYRYQLYLSQRGTLCCRAARYYDGTDKVGAAVYVGCFYNGELRAKGDVDAHAAFFNELMGEPIAFLAQQSKDLGTCCYCNLPLTTPDSKAAGYGETCAANWGLPYGSKYDEKSPGFMRLLGDNNVVEILRGLRDNPQDAAAWAVLDDCFQDAGYTSKKRLGPPAPGVVIPAA